MPVVWLAVGYIVVGIAAVAFGGWLLKDFVGRRSPGGILVGFVILLVGLQVLATGLFMPVRFSASTDGPVSQEPTPAVVLVVPETESTSEFP
jgi:hypothetical protein